MKNHYLFSKWGGVNRYLLMMVLLCSIAPWAWSQGAIKVSGVVTDDKKEPLVGVNIVIKGTTQGTQTGLDGDFVLPSVSPKATLVVSYVGMVTQEIAVAGKNKLNIILKTDDGLLDELVVVGYGRQKKVNLTGSVSSLDAKALETRPVQNVSQALQGLVPGLNLSVNNSGGSLDAGMSINIRGAGTIGAGSGSAPLVLIDGVEGNLNALAPNDVENISVLKDAASSAIYGSRAAFGVILVTTKSGKSGKTRINYSGNVRFSTATQLPNMMDSEMFANYFNRAAANAGRTAIFSEEALEKIKAYKYNNFEGRPEEWRWGTSWYGKHGNEPWRMYGEGWANTDWFAEMYNKNVPSHEHNVSLSGGTEKLNYYLSGAILDRKGLIRFGSDTFQRYNFTGKISAQLAKWANISYTQRWTREDYERPSYMTGLFFHNIARRWPTNILRDPNGYLAHGVEALQMQEGGVDRTQKDYVNHQLNLVLTPIEGLAINIENGYNTTYNNNHWEILPTIGHDPDGKPFYAREREGGVPGSRTQVSESAYKNMYFNGRYWASWSKLFAEKHDLKIVGGMDVELNRYRNLSANRLDLITPDVPTINTSTGKDPGVGGGYSHWSTVGYFARLNYVYNDRYLAELSLRYDGSSRFIDDKTWGLFPSASLGWNISNEAFFAPLKKTINLLKLRASWGALGNTNTDSLYPWAQTIGVTPGGATQGSSWLINQQRGTVSGAPGIVSSTLTWERVESWNFGLDWALFNNRLQGSLDVFSRTTKDMVGPSAPLTSFLGTRQPDQNNSDLRSRGWELELRWRDQVGDFKYGAKFVLSDSQAEVTRFYNPSGSLDSWYAGAKVGDIWGFTTKGLAKTNEEMQEHLAKVSQSNIGSNWAAGDIMYQDLNGDGEISSGAWTLEEHGDARIIGNTSPRYGYSLNLDASYKGFDFSILLQGVAKRDFWDSSPYTIGANTGSEWQAAGFKEHWDFFRPEGDVYGANLNAYYPRVQFGGGKNFLTQTRYLQSAAYMRIKNIQLGYTLPQAWTSKFGVSALRLYASVDNLATFTKMTKIFDPEATGGGWGAGKLYPLQRVISFGLNVNL